MTENLDMASPNLVSKNIEQIAALFPNCITESAHGKTIDFDILKQELSHDIIEGRKERYRLDWPGRYEAIVTANLSTTKTLRPIINDSLDFNLTENIFIEGDNLEVLKLLQEGYLSKVKLIYVDPPYNTGKDFIYRDNYTQDKAEFKKDSGLVNDYNERLVANPESAGRYHSDWLTMMYSRLKLARNLLSDDGVIMISIDDNELYNLRKICDEIFGSENWLGTIVWKNATDNNPTQVAIEHEYVLMFSKYKSKLSPVWKSKTSDVKNTLIEIGKTLNSAYNELDELKTAYSIWFRDHKNELWPLDRYKYIDKGGVYTGSQSVHNPGREGYRYDVLHPITNKACKQPLMGYRFPESTMKELLEQKKILFGEDETKIIELKLYAHEFSEKLSSIIEFDGRIGSYDLKTIFEDSSRIFTNPKPVKFLAHLFDFIIEKGDLVLDFFAGSGTTGHAVMQLNSQDNGNRKFILVQLPEKIDEKTEAFKAGYKKISEITKERIRRASKKIKEETNATIDYGFRAFILDDSNMRDVYYRPQDYTQDALELFTDNVKDDRTSDDLLTQIMLDWSLPLSLNIEQIKIKDQHVYKVAKNSLMACFGKGIDEAFAREAATHKPLRIVFRDSSFKDDTAKENVRQLLKQLSPETEMRVI